MNTLKKIFDIFIPKPTIEVECFTDQRVIYEAYGPELARDSMPDWWKSMQSTRKMDTPTYRGLDNATKTLSTRQSNAHDRYNISCLVTTEFKNI